MLFYLAATDMLMNLYNFIDSNADSFLDKDYVKGKKSIMNFM